MNVRTIIKSASTSGNRKSWLKLVTGVDLSKGNGFAFEGDFLKEGIEIEIPVGAIVIEKEPTGSVKNSSHTWNIYRVSPIQIQDVRNPNLEFLEEFKESNFLSFRDYVAGLLAGAQASEDIQGAQLEAAIAAYNALADSDKVRFREAIAPS
jgi:hypothetical protein